MKKFKKILAMALAVTTISTGLMGCSMQKESVIAVIEGEKVTESLYRTYLWSTQQFFEQLSGPAIWDMELEGKKTPDIAKERALESAILSVVTAKKAEELDIELTKEEKKAAKDNAENFMKVNAEVAKTYKFNQGAVEKLLIATSLSEKVQVKLSENYMPSKEEIQKYITDNKASYEKVRAKHILISIKDKNEQPLSEEKQKEKKALAQEVLQKALAGEDMVELAKTYSEDPGSVKTGGEYTFGKGEMVAEFEAAAFGGKDGQVWPTVVETIHGYHIIKTEEHVKADEAKIKEDYIQKAKNEFSNKEFGEMIKNAKVEKTPEYEALTITKPQDKKSETEQTKQTEEASETSASEDQTNKAKDDKKDEKKQD